MIVKPAVILFYSSLFPKALKNGAAK